MARTRRPRRDRRGACTRRHAWHAAAMMLPQHFALPAPRKTASGSSPNGMILDLSGRCTHTVQLYRTGTGTGTGTGTTAARSTYGTAVALHTYRRYTDRTLAAGQLQEPLGIPTTCTCSYSRVQPYYSRACRLRPAVHSCTAVF
eukprot:COSAG01_NODE_8638_length_2712_cov_1.239571_1_plen_143_part_10